MDGISPLPWGRYAKYDNSDPNSPNTTKEAIEVTERIKYCGSVTKTMPIMSLFHSGVSQGMEGLPLVRKLSYHAW